MSVFDLVLTAELLSGLLLRLLLVLDSEKSLSMKLRLTGKAALISLPGMSLRSLSINKEGVFRVWGLICSFLPVFPQRVVVGVDFFYWELARDSGAGASSLRFASHLFTTESDQEEIQSF